jgi:hypothetical protein
VIKPILQARSRRCRPELRQADHRPGRDRGWRGLVNAAAANVSGSRICSASAAAHRLGIGSCARQPRDDHADADANRLVYAAFAGMLPSLMALVPWAGSIAVAVPLICRAVQARRAEV